MRMAFIIALLVLMAGSASAQTGSNAVLVDEFGTVNCEDFLARSDNFFNQLNAQPNAIGQMAIFGGEQALGDKLRYENWFRGAMHNRNFDPARMHSGDTAPSASAFLISA